jgi:hypothetical protein
MYQFRQNGVAAAWRTDIGNVGDILGTRKRVNGDAGKLLTDARETSYVI